MTDESESGEDSSSWSFPVQLAIAIYLTGLVCPIIATVCEHSPAIGMLLGISCR